MQISLSACLIVKNEEKYLARCLESVKDIASEIIIVDTGSSDHSLMIAKQFSDQVYTWQWQDDFSSARNYGLDLAGGEWILVIDGDEELDSQCRGLLQAKIKTSDTEAYLLTIKHYSHNQHELLAADLQLRLFRNNKKYRYKGAIYEQILESILANPSGRIEMASDICFTHYGYADEAPENRYRLRRNVELVNKVLSEDETIRNLYLGREYYKHHQFSQALEHFCPVYKADSQAAYYPELLRSIAVSLYMMDKSTDALAFLNNALQVLPDMGDLYYLQAIIYRDNALYLESYRSFKDCLQVPVQEFSQSSIYCLHKDIIYYYLGGLAEYFMDKETALSYYYRSLQQNPYRHDSLRRMITILDPRTNPEYTVQSLEKLFDLSDAAVQMQIASIYCDNAACRLALQMINHLEGRGPISEKVRLLKGLCLLRVKQYSEAEEELQQINSCQSLFISAQQYLLIYYWLQNDHFRIAEGLKKMNNADSPPEMVYVLTLLSQGDASPRNVDRVSALLLAKETLELLVELGDSQQVNDAFQNLVPLLGERPSHLLAELFYKHGQNELAAEEYDYLLQTNQLDAKACYYLGKTCRARGDLNHAVKYLYEALEKGLNTPKLRMEITRLHQEQAIAALKECTKLCPANRDREALIQEYESALLEV